MVLEASDWVEIRSGSGEVLFQGEIEPDFNAGKPPDASDSERNQPQALGYWIHRTQKEFTPDDWARFFEPGHKYYGYVKKAEGT